MDYTYLADVLLDSLVAWRGVQDTIIYLLESKFTKEDLRDLGFTEEDIDYAMEIIK